LIPFFNPIFRPTAANYKIDNLILLMDSVADYIVNRCIIDDKEGAKQTILHMINIFQLYIYLYFTMSFLFSSWGIISLVFTIILFLLCIRTVSMLYIEYRCRTGADHDVAVSELRHIIYTARTSLVDLFYKLGGGALHQDHQDHDGKSPRQTFWSLYSLHGGSRDKPS
jgi:hypothetical protein